MKSYLSIKPLSNNSSVSFLQASFTLILMVSLSACNLMQSPDYAVKDSLYVWSDSFDDEIEANKIETDYQTISSLEESLLNNDVQLIFEAMVNNEIADIDLSSEIENEEVNEVQKESEVLDVVPEAYVALEAETALAIQSTQIESVEDINRITEETPTAAGMPIEKVLPEIKTDITEIDLPNEILLLASPAEYQLGVSEYGMWLLAKSNDSAYQELCSLSSSTMQVAFENYSTQVWLRVVGNDLLVNSTTNIDVHKPNVGVKFDGGSLQAFNKSYFDTSAIWSGNLEASLNNNKQLRINLGGNELGKRTQELAINLKDLKEAYSEYRKCNRGTQIGSL